ncbi:hypothetical protein [Streptomyces sp. NPDC058254]|uniref:hypothetical protein n=1 Tax=Streptomyces sp. NPDC058254 TaxID=3346406 RepID=UPI0036E71ED4
MESTPTVVHPPTPTGGRWMAIQGHVAGIARSDADLVELRCQAGVTVHSALLDDETWVKRRGERAHHYAAR